MSAALSRFFDPDVMRDYRPDYVSILEYEELLNDHGFFRIHQSHIVNLRHVEAFLKQDGGQVQMSDGSLLTISRNRKASFMRKFF